MVINIYLSEFKYRVYYSLLGSLLSFILIYTYSIECFYLLAEPYSSVVGSGFFLTINVFEIIYVYIKIALIFSLIYFIIMLSMNVWHFIIPTLYQYKYKKIKLFVKLNLVFFIILVMFLLKYGFKLIFIYLLQISDISFYGNYTFDIEPRLLNFIELLLNIFMLFIVLLYIPIVLLIGAFIIYSMTHKIFKYRSWFYMLVISLILLLLPPDFILHLVVFSLILTFFEIIIFIILLSLSYKNSIE